MLSMLMNPEHANALGNVHGGVIMKLVDEAGGLAAMRHARSPVVTVAIDSMTFDEPIYVGNLVTLTAELTYIGRTSMEVRVSVAAEDPLTGARSPYQSGLSGVCGHRQPGTPAARCRRCVSKRPKNSCVLSRPRNGRRSANSAISANSRRLSCESDRKE